MLRQQDRYIKHHTTGVPTRAVQEVVRGRHREVELERVDDVALHPEHVLPREGLVRDVDEVPDLGGVDLLVLGGDQHRGAADELEPGPVHVRHVEESVEH